MVDIKNLDKAEVLLALWKHSRQLGLSFLGENGMFGIESARIVVENTPELYFDYVCGHVIKCDLKEDTFDPWRYDRDNGPGKAQEAINELRKEKGI